jgi:hypothetical protein
MSDPKPQIPVLVGIGRLGRAGGADPVVDREGGKFGAGIIRGVSLACVGEALGHEMWLDQETINQVSEYSKAKSENGLKCRFTHPGMSSDGMGRHLGRLFDVQTDGNKSVGDLHFTESSHKTPDGDLAEYVMKLTEEDPTAAGLSIVFHHDAEAESEFEAQHQEEYKYEDYRGRSITSTRFKSPDPNNENSYPHVRINELRAADIVDEPAANPDGLFDRHPLARQADELLSFAAGLSDKQPNVSSFGIDGQRAQQFFDRWLESHQLSLTPTTEKTAMADKPEAPQQPAAPEVTRESLLAEQKRYTDKFGAENGVKWFSEGKTYEEALELFCDNQSQQIVGLQTSLKESEDKLASLSLGEDEPVPTTPGGDEKKVTFAQATRRAK